MRSSDILALGAITAITFACASPYTRVQIHQDDAVEVVLRSRNEGGRPVDRGFRHPATISNVRLAHILASLDVRTGVTDEGGGQRVPAVHTDLVYPLGDHLSAAFKQADPTQEVVIQAIRRERNLGIFTQKYVTSFVAWVDSEDRLQIHLSRVDWALPKGEEEEDLREPVPGREVQRFRVIPSETAQPAGAQGLAIDWRDPGFRKGANLSVSASGRVQRRTILMESPDVVEEDAVEDRAPLLLPSDPEVLRQLADLEEARKRGEIPEADYLRRRRELLTDGSGGGVR